MDEKLTPLALFDDLCRAAHILTEDNTEDIIRILTYAEQWRKKCTESDFEVHALREQCNKILAEKHALESNLVHARGAIEIEMKRRIAAEQERDLLENQVALIRELLANDPNGLNDVTRERLAFLQSTYNVSINKQESPKRYRLDTINESSGSILSSEDLSYDRTDDNIDESRNGNNKEKRSSVSEVKRRPSAPPMHDLTPPKRIKTRHSTESTAMSDILDVDNAQNKRKSVARRESEINIVNEERHRFRQDETVESDISVALKGYTTPEIQSRYTPLKNISSASRLSNKKHDFCSKTIIKPETCTPCGKKISFGKSAFRCRDCRAVCHIECREKVPLPCVPVVFTPNIKGTKGVIADYAPLTSPMIPPLIIHCINEIESRGLKEVGIYRVNGSDKEIKDLKDRFLRGKTIPNLSRVTDIYSICGCVKDFLRSLREPLIITIKWKDFVNAAECDDLNPLFDALSSLPKPNLDTLAYFILHLQKVAESPHCKMPISNLAKIFGPTIVGYSSIDPDPTTMLYETKKQTMVIERLLNISEDYWKKLIEVDNSFTETRENKIVSDRRESVGKGKLVHTPLAPRESSKHKTMTRKSMTFCSPMVLGGNY